MKPVIRKESFLPVFDRFFDDFFTKDLFENDWKPGWLEKSFTPAVNVKESDQGFALEVAAPGFEKKDFKVEIENGVLSVSTEKKEEKEEKEEGKYTRKEFHFAAFKRSFRLPENIVEDENIQAKYEDGILKLFLPKKAEAKPQPVRTIEIG